MEDTLLDVCFTIVTGANKKCTTQHSLWIRVTHLPFKVHLPVILSISSRMDAAASISRIWPPLAPIRVEHAAIGTAITLIIGFFNWYSWSRVSINSRACATAGSLPETYAGGTNSKHLYNEMQCENNANL